MEIMPYRLDESIYRAIHQRFSDKKDIEIVTFVLEQALSNQSQVVIDTVNKKIDQIIYEVQIELKKEFATKVDLDNVRLILEKQIANLETKFEKRFGDLDKKIAVLDEKIVNLDKKIDSNLKWIGLIVSAAVIIVGIISNLGNIFPHLFR